MSQNPNFVFVQTANLNDLTIASMLSSPLISKQVMNQASTLSGIRKKQFVACRYLLAELLNQHFATPYLPTIIISENHRPQFKQTHLPDFNISHSGSFVAVTLCTQGRIGLDIELARPRANYWALAKQCFSPQENHWLNQQPCPLAAFWQLWTLRESALKLYAKGVWQMKELQINMPWQHISAKFATHFHPQYKQFEEFHLSVCCNKAIDLLSINQSVI